MSERDMFRGFPKALSVERTCTRNACTAPQACVSNFASLKFSSGRPTLGSRICDVLSNGNIWAWARGGSRCGGHIWWESGFNLVAACAAELNPNIAVHSTVFTRRWPPSPAYPPICSFMPAPQNHHQHPPRPIIIAGDGCRLEVSKEKDRWL